MPIFLSIVIPAYNEAKRLPETLALIKDFLENQPYAAEVLVVDDGSKDGTAQVAKKIAQRFPQLRVIENTHNKGKGAVVKQGMLLAKGDFRLFMDADNSTTISEVEKLLVYTPEYEVVIGSRYLVKGSVKVKQPWKRRLISRTGHLWIRTFLLPGIKDTQCGFKLFSAQAAERIFPLQSLATWAFDIELLTIATSLGYPIKEVAVEWFDAKHSTMRGASRTALRFLHDLFAIREKLQNGFYQ